MKPVLNTHLANLTELVERIELHNGEYSFGAQLGRAIGGLLAVGNIESARKREVLSSESRSMTEAESLSREFARCLAATGLQLAHDRGAGAGRSLESKEGRAGNNVITSHSISFEVLDGKRVQEFLTRLNRRDVEKESANKALRFLARALDDDFVNAYCQAQADPEAKRYQELVEPIGEIISEFVRLGMQEHAAILRAHLERSIDGDLSAFLLADSQGLLVLRNFHAGHWHTDSTSDGYERRWTGS